MGKEPITGKVARVLNDRELVINRGSNHGVSEGMRFQVFDCSDALSDIRDPETGEGLGSFHRESVKVKIVELNEAMSIGRTYEGYTRTEGGPFAAITLNARRTTYYQTLRRDRTYTTGGYEDIEEDESAVHIGDDVLEIVEAEAASDQS